MFYARFVYVPYTVLYSRVLIKFLSAYGYK